MTIMKTIATTTVLLAALATGACASTRTQQAPGEAIDDTVVTTRVKSALIGDPVTKARQIEVETFRGTVQLSGFVDSAEEKSRAAEVARGVTGVMKVENNLAVEKAQRSAGEVIDDGVLTTKVKAALIDNPLTKARQINVKTSMGVVQLSGFVDSAAEKAEATKVAADITGVTSVSNELEVKKN